MPVYYISILRARQSFDPCAFVLCASSRLSPIFCPLLSSPICRNVFTRALPLAATFPYSPLAFYCRRYAAMLLLAFCRLPHFSPIFCPLLSSPICRNAFTRALLFVASFPSPLFAFYRRHVPRCVRSRFDLCRLYLSLFPAPASAQARFAVRALTANRSALKKPPR